MTTAFAARMLGGKQISVHLLQADGRYKPWHGYVLGASQLGSDGGLARYRLVMRPWLAFIAHSLLGLVACQTRRSTLDTPMS